MEHYNNFDVGAYIHLRLKIWKHIKPNISHVTTWPPPPVVPFQSLELPSPPIVMQRSRAVGEHVMSACNPAKHPANLMVGDNTTNLDGTGGDGDPVGLVMRRASLWCPHRRRGWGRVRPWLSAANTMEMKHWDNIESLSIMLDKVMGPCYTEGSRNSGWWKECMDGRPVAILHWQQMFGSSANSCINCDIYKHWMVPWKWWQRWCIGIKSPRSLPTSTTFNLASTKG